MTDAEMSCTYLKRETEYLERRLIELTDRLEAKIKEVEDNVQVMRTAMSSTDRQGIADIQGTARHMLGSVIQNWLKESEGAE